MRDRVKTLLIYANGGHWKEVLAETIIRGVLRFQGERILPAGWPQPRFIAKLLLRDRYETLGYVNDWIEAFCQAPELDVQTCNVSNLVESRHYRKAVEEYPLVVILHSATGDNMWMLQQKAGWFQRRKGKLLIFVGNEYNLMDDKFGFIRSVGADYVGSQLPRDAAEWLYADCPNSKALSTPHALNPKVYRPGPPTSRPIDIGFVGAPYLHSIGDNERTTMIQYLREHGEQLNLRCDIRYQRMPREQWASFLTECTGIVGAESGTYFLERNSETLNAASSYLKARPEATFEEVYEKFFKTHPRPMSGKCISSRHFEPIGAKSCLMMVEGRYNDILIGDEHYISVRKDLSNIAEAVERFKDQQCRTKMVERTYEYVMAEHTYMHRVRNILKAILAV